MAKSLTEEVKEEIRNRHATGQKATEIATALGISLASARRYAGIKTKARRKPVLLAAPLSLDSFGESDYTIVIVKANDAADALFKAARDIARGQR